MHVDTDRASLKRKRRPLTKIERKALDRQIAERIIALSERDDTLDRRQGVEALRTYVRELDQGYVASPPDRWLFPSVAARRASEQAKGLAAAGHGRDTSTLRMITLRVGDRKPAPSELAGHLRLLSEAARSCGDYLAGQGLAQPILSVMQLRRPDADGTLLDPHIHGIWEFPEEAIDRVRRYLAERFTSAWIDDVPVQQLKAAAFYIGSGMLDYRDLPAFPDEAVEAIWMLPRIRMIRRAGWFAEPPYVDGPEIDQKPSLRAPKRIQAAPSQNPDKIVQRSPIAAGPRSSPRGRNRADAQTTTPTVRTISSESLNLGKTPTLSELWFTWRVAYKRLNGEPATIFETTCAMFGIPAAEGIEAIRATEAAFKVTLFYPGGDWIPTKAAAPFIEGSLPLLKGFAALHEDLSLEAKAAAMSLQAKPDNP